MEEVEVEVEDGTERTLATAVARCFYVEIKGRFFVENEDLNGVDLRDALYAGPVPADCRAFSLEALHWNLLRNCPHSSCEGVWLLSGEENFLELLEQELEHIDVPNLVHDEQEEEHEGDEEPEHDEEGGEVIEGELYQTINVFKALEFGKKATLNCRFHRVLDETVFEDVKHLEIASSLQLLSRAVIQAYVSEDGGHVDYWSIHGFKGFKRCVRTIELNLDPIRRTCSDSEVILDVLTSYKGEFEEIEEKDETDSLSEVGLGLDSGCLYGPNSPRQKSRLSTNESSVVNAVLENVPSNPLQYLVLNPESCTGSGPASGLTEMHGDGDEDASNASVNNDLERNSRRRSGQRSRVRKLQYIAELERTVESLQSFGAEMATRVASYFQLHAALSMENRNLRRKIASLKQEKLVKDGVAQALRNELERQKQILGRHRRSRSMASCSDMVGPGPLEQGPPENSLALNWQMLELDMNKLSLGGSPVHVPLTRHSSGRF